MPSERKHPINIEFVYPEGSPVAFINATKFAHLGLEIFLDLAILDDQQLIQFLNGPDEENQKVRAFVQYRAALSLQALLKLKQNIDDILRTMQKTGGVLSEGFDGEKT
jgi:hypothetical protein